MKYLENDFISDYDRAIEITRLQKKLRALRKDELLKLQNNFEISQ